MPQPQNLSCSFFYKKLKSSQKKFYKYEQKFY